MWSRGTTAEIFISSIPVAVFFRSLLEDERPAAYLCSGTLHAPHCATQVFVCLAAKLPHFSPQNPCKIRDPDLPKNPSRSKSLFQRRSLPFTPHCGGQRITLVTIANHSRGTGMVLHLADKASANTTNAASSTLAISENIACCGCAWK
jgi:hypothetical protein